MRLLAVTDGPRWVQCHPGAHVLFCAGALVVAGAGEGRSLIILWNGEGAKSERVWNQLDLSLS
jgi:hypothetical protein